MQMALFDTYSTQWSGADTHDYARPARAMPLVLDLAGVSRVLWTASAVVIALGIFREVLIFMIGTETIVEDLRQLAMDAEHCLPAWYESTLMVIAAGLLAISSKTTSRFGDKVLWMILAAIFVAFSIDESVSFHEVAIDPIRSAFDLSGALYFSWVLAAAPLLVIFLLAFSGFLLRLPAQTAIGFIVAGTVFVAGAFGMEFVGGYLVSEQGFDSPVYKAAAIIEESLEIIGMTLFILAILQHLARSRPQMLLNIRG
jgi:hypothetical protein